MKKILLLLSLLLLTACGKREDYYIFSFDNFTIAPGYDNVEFLKLIFDVNVQEELGAEEKLEDVEIYFWNEYLGSVDLINEGMRIVPIDKALVSRVELYLDNLPYTTLKINDTILSDSVKENCEMFGGEYLERYASACAFGQKVDKKSNIVILYGDVLGIDQDKLAHLEIYVK